MQKYILIALLFYLGSFAVFAQRVVTVMPDSVGALNNAIIADTIATGERVDRNTIYELKRNGVYKLTGEIQNPGFPLVVRAEAGTGSLPILQPTAPDGGESQSPFVALDNITLENLYITAVDDFGRYLERMIRVRSNGTRVSINGCWLDGTGQSFVRLDNLNTKIYIRNSILSNVGRTFIPNNGRIIDARESTDSVLVENNTMYNITSRISRITDGRVYNFVMIRNNTIVNSAQRLVGFNETVFGAFIDNIVVNGGFLGTTRTSEIIESEILNEELAAQLASQGIEQVLDIRNNLFFTQPEVQAIRQDFIENNTTDTVDNMPFYDENTILLSAIDSAELFNDFTFTEPIQFVNPPVLQRNVIEGMLNDQLFAENIDDGDAPNWGLFESPFNALIDNNLQLPWEFPYNLSFSPISFAASAATDGGALGDRNWPLTQVDIVTSIAKKEPSVLHIYPNPTTEKITVAFAKPIVGELCVYDVKGSVIFKRPVVGEEVIINVISLQKGMYFIAFTDENARKFVEPFIKE